WCFGLITVHLGEATTFTCDLPHDKYGSGELFWYRQTIGDTLELVVTFMNYANPTYGPRYTDSRMKISHTETMSNLTILKTVQEDEGMYHCAFTDWTQTVWHGTYLLIKGNGFSKPFYEKVVQSLTTSDSLRAEEYVTLQCSVLSNFDRTCSEDGIFWFMSNNSDTDIIFVDGNKTDRCQKKTDYQTRCVYNFSKNISSSDAGTYYCAVAACGQILFGNGTKLEAERRMNLSHQDGHSVSKVINLGEWLTLSSMQCNKHFFAVQNEDGQDLNYAALHFSDGKARRGKKINVTEDSVYSHIKL
uniref:Ig-like domain-containing protein n=1 Tax=Fundulus heteroclitus TaxID=8078 RepID=A0A3Q2UQ04_FUNHE